MSLESIAAEFRSKEIYLLHGTFDTSVPLEHTMLFSKSLIANHAFFHQQVLTRAITSFPLPDMIFV
jgi:hypothetical protein